MLRLARKLNPEVTYLTDNIREVRLNERFDAVLIHDSINYMLTQKDLKAAFKTAFLHLKPGGILYTFVEEYRRIEQNKLTFSTHKANNIEITFIEHHYDHDPEDTTYENTFIYLIRKNKKLRIYTDRHLCGIFELNTWLKTLRQVGFRVKKLKFEHSKIPKEKIIPELICLKPL